MTVGIVRATTDSIDQGMAELLRLIGYQPQRDALFIKPNVPDAGPPGRGLYADPAVVEAFLKCFPGKQAVIGEGCIVGRDADQALARTGYTSLAERYGAQAVDLERVERFEADWRFGRLRLPTYLRTHEYVNVAKMKTHVQAGATLGMKNQKGLLTHADKRRFHRLGLNECIQALAQVVQPALTIVDGVVALEGDGPWRYGRPKPMNLLVAGTDLIEVPLDPSLRGQPLTITFHSQGARFSVQAWKLKRQVAQGKATVRSVTPQPEALSGDCNSECRYTIPALDPAQADRRGEYSLALIIVRLDLNEKSDPVGAYQVIVDSAQ